MFKTCLFHTTDADPQVIEEQSLLSREESAAIKGLLIALVVLGHNSIITQNIVIGGKKIVFPWLYSFHVYGFYILPFIYGFSFSGTTSSLIRYLGKRIRQNIVKLYPLYFLFGILCVLIYVFHEKENFNDAGIVWALTTGYQPLLYQYIGFGFLWFLPTYCAILLWHDIYFAGNKTGRAILIAACTVFWVAGWWWGNDASYIPFALITGLRLSLLGILARIILEKGRNGIIFRIISLLLFCLIPVFIYFRDDLPEIDTFISRLVLPIIGFVFLFSFKEYLSRSRLLRLLGRYSLPIYLLHVFVFNLFLYLSPVNNLPAGFVIYFLTMGITLATTMFIRRIPRVNSLFCLQHD